MTKAVFDTNVLVSAFLSRNNPGGVSNELLRFARRGELQIHLSPEVVAEVLATLVEDERIQKRYDCTSNMALQFCDDLVAAAIVVANAPPTPGAVPRDPEDDKIIACAVAAGAEYLVTRDRDLLSLGAYNAVSMISPEAFLQKLRTRSPNIP